MKITKKFKVGKFTVHWTLESVKPPRCEAAWTPHVPMKEEMTDDMWLQYRKGRTAFMEEVAQRLGGNVLVVE